jgi:hypothetical protein
MKIPKLSNASSARGAQMGRGNTLPADPKAPIKLNLEQLRWVDGDYDPGGAYWGYTDGTNIYRATGESGGVMVELFARAASRGEAKQNIRSTLPNATFYKHRDDGKAQAATPKMVDARYTLLDPVIITARLLPGVRVGKSSISITYAKHQGRDGRVRYQYYIDTPDFEFEGHDLESGRSGGNLRDGLESLLGFLGAAADAYRQNMKADKEDCSLPANVQEWACRNDNGLQQVQCEVEENKNCIQEN